jgi:predicted transcriptional regulator
LFAGIAMPASSLIVTGNTLRLRATAPARATRPGSGPVTAEAPQRAYNTVLTVVEILYRKGWLSREEDGRAYQYRATVSREECTADLMGEALAASTDRAAMLRRFAERIDPAEAEELREALEQALRTGSTQWRRRWGCWCTRACCFLARPRSSRGHGGRSARRGWGSPPG